MTSVRRYSSHTGCKVTWAYMAPCSWMGNRTRVYSTLLSLVVCRVTAEFDAPKSDSLSPLPLIFNKSLSSPYPSFQSLTERPTTVAYTNKSRSWHNTQTIFTCPLYTVTPKSQLTTLLFGNGTQHLKSAQMYEDSTHKTQLRNGHQ